MESEANYVLALKGNHKHLAEDVKDAFTGRSKEFAYNTLEKDHGRVEERTYTALCSQEVLDESQCDVGPSKRSVQRGMGEKAER